MSDKEKKSKDKKHTEDDGDTGDIASEDKEAKEKKKKKDKKAKDDNEGVTQLDFEDGIVSGKEDKTKKDKKGTKHIEDDVDIGDIAREDKEAKEKKGKQNKKARKDDESALSVGFEDDIVSGTEERKKKDKKHKGEDDAVDVTPRGEDVGGSKKEKQHTTDGVGIVLDAEHYEPGKVEESGMKDERAKEDKLQYGESSLKAMGGASTTQPKERESQIKGLQSQLADLQRQLKTREDAATMQTKEHETYVRELHSEMAGEDAMKRSMAQLAQKHSNVAAFAKTEQEELTKLKEQTKSDIARFEGQQLFQQQILHDNNVEELKAQLAMENKTKEALQRHMAQKRQDEQEVATLRQRLERASQGEETQAAMTLQGLQQREKLVEQYHALAQSQQAEYNRAAVAKGELVAEATQLENWIVADRAAAEWSLEALRRRLEEQEGAADNEAKKAVLCAELELERTWKAGALRRLEEQEKFKEETERSLAVIRQRSEAAEIHARKAELSAEIQLELSSKARADAMFEEQEKFKEETERSLTMIRQRSEHHEAAEIKALKTEISAEIQLELRSKARADAGLEDEEKFNALKHRETIEAEHLREKAKTWELEAAACPPERGAWIGRDGRSSSYSTVLSTAATPRRSPSPPPWAVKAEEAKEVVEKAAAQVEAYISAERSELAVLLAQMADSAVSHEKGKAAATLERELQATSNLLQQERAERATSEIWARAEAREWETLLAAEREARTALERRVRNEALRQRAALHAITKQISELQGEAQTPKMNRAFHASAKTFREPATTTPGGLDWLDPRPVSQHAAGTGGSLPDVFEPVPFQRARPPPTRQNLSPARRGVQTLYPSPLSERGVPSACSFSSRSPGRRSSHQERELRERDRDRLVYDIFGSLAVITRQGPRMGLNEWRQLGALENASVKDEDSWLKAYASACYVFTWDADVGLDLQQFAQILTLEGSTYRTTAQLRRLASKLRQ